MGAITREAGAPGDAIGAHLDDVSVARPPPPDGAVIALARGPGDAARPRSARSGGRAQCALSVGSRPREGKCGRRVRSRGNPSFGRLTERVSMRTERGAPKKTTRGCSPARVATLGFHSRAPLKTLGAPRARSGTGDGVRGLRRDDRADGVATRSRATRVPRVAQSDDLHPGAVPRVRAATRGARRDRARVRFRPPLAFPTTQPPRSRAAVDPRSSLPSPSPRRALRGAPTQARERHAHLARVARPRLPSRVSSRPGLRPRPRLESSRGRAPRGDVRGEPGGCRRGNARPPPPRRGYLPPGRVLPHTHAQARRGRLRVRAEGLRRGGSRRGEARRLRSSARPRRRSRRRKKNRRGGASFASRRPVPPRGARAERVAPASPRRARGADRGAAARGG